MAEVKTAAGGGSVGDSTIIILFGGLALLLIGGVWYARKTAEDLLQGVKDIGGDVFGAGVAAVDEAKGAVASSGEYYGKKYYAAELARKQREYLELRITTAEAIQKRTEAVGGSNYGTVDGSIGSYTGKWMDNGEDAGGSPKCYVIHSTQYSSNAHRMFTGGYCRRAKDQGLL